MSKRSISAKNGNQMKATKFPGVYSRVGIHRRGKHKGKVDTAFYISFEDSDGKKIWKKIGWSLEGVTVNLASQYRGEWARKIRLGEELPWKKKKIPLFSEVADLYLEWGKENKASDRDDRSRYDNHLKDSLGSKRLNTISSFDLERLKSDLVKKGLAPATVKHCLVLVREIFNKAAEWGKYKGPNPIKGVKLPRLNNQRERFLTHEEADALLNRLAPVSKAVHDQALLALHCGLRAGEIFNLRGQDLDFENSNGIIRIMDPKGGSPRTAYMTNAVREMLKKRMPKNPADLIFEDRWHGEPIKTVSKTFDRAVAELGFNDGLEDSRQKVVFHSLRHTFASWLAIQGTPILTIKELMGHKTLTMTERYAHLLQSHKQRAALALEANFEASRNGTKVIPLAASQQVPANPAP